MKPSGGWRQTPALLLSAVLLVGLLAACGSGNAGNGADASGNASASSGNDGSSGGSSGGEPAIVEITAWDKPAPDSPNKSVMESLFAKFEETHPNIKVTHVDATQTNSREKFMTAVAGGEQPDVSSPAFPDMQVYVPKGIAADITDLINASPDKDRFIDGAFDLATKDGRIYGIPSNMYVTGLFYNKKLFKNAGIESPPKTWDEFAQTAQKVMAANPGTVGFDILGMDWADWHFEYYVWQAGGDLTEVQPDGTVKLLFTSDAAVKALQYYKDLKWKYKVTQNNVLQDYPENQKDFYTGHSAMILGASDNYFTFVGKGMNPDDLGFAPFPVGPAGVAPSQVGGAFWMFNPKSTPEELKASFDYAMFFMSKESQETVLQFNKDNGLGINPLQVVKDVDVTDYVEDMPADFIQAIGEAAKNQHLEYYLKSSLSPYLVKPIQKILLDPNADPLTELKAAQELAQKEVVDKYNADILNGTAN
jgi:ABC-type glycerol-3-phosphate transport system substrate-binding protein